MKLKAWPAKEKKGELPLVPLKELVVFPHMIIPIFVGRDMTVRSIEEAMNADRTVFLACQKKKIEDPGEEDIYAYGVSATIVQMLKLPDDTLRILVEGKQRGVIKKYVRKSPFMKVRVSHIEESKEITDDISALMRTLQKSFASYAQNNKKITQETIDAVEKAEFPDKLVNLIAAQVPLKIEQKIELLQITDTHRRLDTLAVSLESENEVSALQNKIQNKVKKRLEKSQKEYFLNEQIREINKELGRGEEDPTGAKDLEKKLEAMTLPDEVRTKAHKELSRLSRLGPMSPEAGVLRTYLEWICDLPWSEKTEDNRDIEAAEKILDEDHYDMKKPKERILDFLAVRQLKDKTKGPIICFVGPPGTGKTSLGKSVARAMGRKFIRISLGGVKDEAEIRGHRKTYVGALPGKIIQSMKKAETINPVFMLDEIDKLNSDFRGDPASALLEVLDPEQNSTFTDHYLEVSYDLSNVMFLTTANSIHTIPHPLRDRMEIIEIPGYTDLEKAKIASEFIIPKQLEENGLAWAEIQFQKNAVLSVIRNYTMESGVRNLEREIATIIRKVARKAIKEGYTAEGRQSETAEQPEGEEPEYGEPAGGQPDKPFKSVITEKGLKQYLGKPRYQENSVSHETPPGLAYGLAWTEMGGMLLPVEVSLIEGKGELILTGNLGEVMKESARIALSFLVSNYRTFNISSDFLNNTDIHIHVPEGAIPKDGPSAGITLAAAILSAITGIPLRTGYAMTGEITLTGRLLPIGGVKEKVLAAYRNDMNNVVIPEKNRKDTEELPREILSKITFIYADSMKDGLIGLFPSNSFTIRELKTG
jgi:ATP-dependent Lon protease